MARFYKLSFLADLRRRFFFAPLSMDLQWVEMAGLLLTERAQGYKFFIFYVKQYKNSALCFLLPSERVDDIA